jgi:hypothetical protein
MAFASAAKMATRAIPVVVFPNTAQDILDYLVQRTERTIGARVDQASLVVVGQIEETETRFANESLSILVTRLFVERRLVGASRAKRIDIAYVGAAGSGGGFTPSFQRGDRGVFFLNQVPGDVPGAQYFPRRSYQLASGEKGLEGIEVVPAIEWYASLRRRKALRGALVKALHDVDQQIARQAIRSLARQSDPGVAQLFKERLDGASEDLRARLMLGLWIVGDKAAAERVLEEFFQKHGKYEWLAGWDVQATQVQPGQTVTELYGPDPAELKGD